MAKNWSITGAASASNPEAEFYAEIRRRWGANALRSLNIGQLGDYVGRSVTAITRMWRR